MEILKFEGRSNAPLKQRKGFRVILGITVMGVFGALGSTLAANISINTGPVEFGQGLAAAAACDSSITVSPRASFSNQSETAGVFMLSEITFGGIDTSTSACGGKQFVISTYDSGTATANFLGYRTALSDSYTTVVVNVGNSFTLESMSVTNGLSKPGISTAASGFTLSFDTPLATAGSVYKVTVESRDPIDQ